MSLVKKSTKKKITEAQFVARLKRKLLQDDIVLIEKDEGACQTIEIQGKEINIKWRPPISKLPFGAIKTLYSDCVISGRKLIEPPEENKEVDKSEN